MCINIIFLCRRRNPFFVCDLFRMYDVTVFLVGFAVGFCIHSDKFLMQMWLPNVSVCIAATFKRQQIPNLCHERQYKQKLIHFSAFVDIFWLFLGYLCRIFSLVRNLQFVRDEQIARKNNIEIYFACSVWRLNSGMELTLVFWNLLDEFLLADCPGSHISAVQLHSTCFCVFFMPLRINVFVFVKILCFLLGNPKPEYKLPI